MDHFEEYYNLTKGTDWIKKNSFEDLNKAELLRLENIKNENVEDYLRTLEDERMFIDACIHLQRIYRVISNRYAKDLEEKIQFLSKSYQVCKSSKFNVTFSK